MIYIYRLSHLLYRFHIPLLPWLLKILNRILFSCSVPPSVKVGRNVTFGYQGLGIVIHKHAVLGNDITISPNVVIGGLSGRSGVPVIEDNVQIGAGACVLGSITIGRNAKIGANAVVTMNVPPGATVVGIPARIVSKALK